MNPKISIITPVFNGEQFIKIAIDSVLNQGYSNIEHIVVDGGSTDGTIDILKSYKHLIWVSEKDDGAVHATIKGFEMATGDLLCILPSDDYYQPGALNAVAEYLCNNPKIKWLTGYSRIVDAEGKEIRKPVTVYKNFLLRHHNFKLLLTECYISGQAVFFRRELIEKCGSMDPSFTEYELWLRFAKKYPLGLIRSNLVNFRMHKGATTTSNFLWAERIALDSARKHGSMHWFLMFIRSINHYKIFVTYFIFNRLL